MSGGAKFSLMEELERTTNEDVFDEEQNDTSTDLNETINEYASSEWGVDSISQVLEDQISEMDDVKRRRKEVIQRNSLQFGESSIDDVEQDDDDEWDEEEEEDDEDYGEEDGDEENRNETKEEGKSFTGRWKRWRTRRRGTGGTRRSLGESWR